MSSLRDTRIGLTMAVAFVAMLGVVGQMDYTAAKEAECASYIKPHVYDSKLDACVPITQPTNQEDTYYAAPPQSHPQRDQGTLAASGPGGTR